MQSFKIKEQEFRCKTPFCGKELSFEEGMTKLSCNKCKKGYTIKKKEGAFVIYYEKYPVYPFSVLAEKYNELIKKYGILYKIHRLLSKLFVYLILFGFLLWVFACLVIFGNILNIYLPQLFIVWLTKTPIDLNTGTSISLGIIAAVLLAFIYFVSFGWKILTILIKKRELDNKYLSFGLAISILIILLGGTLFNIFLGSYFPVSITLYPYTLANITVKCMSDGNMMLDPVYGNNFLCSITVKNNDSINLTALYFSEYDYATTNLTIIRRLEDIRWDSNTENYKFGSTFLPIGKEGRHGLQIDAYYTNESHGGIEYTSLIRQQYEDKQYKRLVFIFGLFSVAIFSVFSAMNNINSILER